MNHMGTTAERLIAQDVLSYLMDHTAAEDTIEGIVEWWLLEEQVKRRKKEVQEVLNELVTKNLIVVRKAKDSRIHYRINKREINTIRAMLKARGERN